MTEDSGQQNQLTPSICGYNVDGREQSNAAVIWDGLHSNVSLLLISDDVYSFVLFSNLQV